MKVLHLYANHKWTGPADLALLSAAGLRELGVDVEWAHAGFVHEGMDHAVEARAVELGLPLVKGLQLRRHFHLRAMFGDARRLRAWITEGRWDLVHCHQPGDHMVVAMACRKSPRPPIVRSLWEGVAPKRGPRRRFCFGRCDALHWPFGDEAPELGVPRVLRSEPPIDQWFLREVSPAARDAARARLRAELGLAADATLIGITARIQPRRRWPLLFAALAEAAPSCDVQLAVLGRPDEGVFEELCAEPIARHELEGRVHFLGYRQGKDYIDALLGFDAFHLLVPGSDPSCRALREAMALGLPSVVTSLGRLGEIVEDGVSGLVVDVDASDGAVRQDDAHALGAAFARLAAEASLRTRLGDAAARCARDRWAPQRVAESLEGLYRDLIEARLRSNGAPRR